MSTKDFSVFAQGMQISVRQSGSKGRPLLMLHGSGASKAVFQRQFDSVLSEIYQLTAIDLPGHGDSDNAKEPGDTYTVAGLTTLVETVISTLDLVQPAVFGWSLGGHVGIELAARRRDLSGLVLTGTPPIGHGALASLRGFNARWDLLLASKERFTARDAERYMRLCFGDSGTPEVLANILRADGRMRSHFPRSLIKGGADQKREVETNPMLLAMINGADEPVVRRNYIDHLNYANLWRSACQYIEGAQHAPFLQQPEAFNHLLHAFLKDVAVQPVIEQMRHSLQA